MRASPVRFPIRGTVALRAMLFALTLAVGGAAQVTWQVDLDNARETANRAGKLLLVVVHQHGEPASDAVMSVLLADKGLAAALRDVVPVLVSCGEPGVETRQCAPGMAFEQVTAGAAVAIQRLYGPGATVTVPQQLILHPRGAVLWHNLRGCSRKQLEDALGRSRARLADHDHALAKSVDNAARALAGRAKNDADAYEKLCVLARAADDALFAAVLRAVARDRVLGERLLGDALRGLRRTPAQQRVAALSLHRECAPLLVRADRLAASALADQPQVAVREIREPLPSLRSSDALSDVRFADGVARDLPEFAGRVVVLWHFLPDDPANPGDPERMAPALGEQLAAVRPLFEELQRDGAVCLALGATLDPEIALRKLGATSFPCPLGVYRYDSGKPLQGVGYFPAVVVLDEAGRIVYSDAAAGDHAYGAFAPTARGLLRSLADRAVAARSAAPSK